MSFDSGGKGGSDGGKAKKGGFLDGLRSFGADFADAFARNLGGGVGVSADRAAKPTVDCRDPVAVRDRPIAARQIQRRLKIERKAAEEEAGKQEAAAPQADDQLDQETATAGVDEASPDSGTSTKGNEVSADGGEAGKQGASPEGAPTAAETEKEGEGEGKAEAEAEGEEAKPSLSVAAKLKGVHRKIFRKEDERTPGVGVMLGPIKAKVQQALDMMNDWSKHSDPTLAATCKTAADMLREVRTMIQNLEDKPPKGAALTAHKQAIEDKCKEIQNNDPDYKLYSIGNAGRTVNRAKDIMPVVKPPAFICPPHLDIEEYRLQVRQQQQGMNSLLVSDWKKNKDAFDAAGRSVIGNAMQKKYQARYGNPGGVCAPHNSDQVAGGCPDPTGRPGDIDVNSSIGPSWTSRIKDVTDAVDLVKPAANRATTQMNVDLKVDPG